LTRGGPLEGVKKKPLWGTCIRIYAGQYFDNETGLHFNWNRYYEPQLGRYLRADPIGLKGGVNLFSYTYNNPTNIIDPMGLDFGDYLNKITNQKVRKAWALTASAAIEARVGSGVIGGKGIVGVFFPDTCEIASYLTTAVGFPYEGDPSNYGDSLDRSEQGLFFGIGAGQEVAEWFGNPNNATPESFEGPFHTLGLSFSIPGTPLGAGVSGYAGEFSAKFGGFWLGGTGTIGPGAGVGVMTWNYKMVGKKIHVDECACKTLTLMIP
jgi:RHS repeat-associated protein